MAALCLAGALGGCNAAGGFDPGAFLHGFEGGTVAQQNAAPPGVGRAYPSLHTVPARPDIPTPAVQQGLRNQLLAERQTVDRVGTRFPLPVEVPHVPPSPSATPAGAATPAAAGQAAAAQAATQNTMSATLPAADAGAKPASAAAAPKLPPGSPGFPPLPTPAMPHLSGPPVLLGALPATGDLPAVPAGPPPSPDFADMPTLPAPAIVPPVPAFVPPEDRGTVIAFAAGGATLTPQEAGQLRSLAAAHHGATFAVTGHGDTYADTADAQLAAIGLGLDRAQAIAGALLAGGATDRSIRLGADAFGTGGDVKLQ